MREGVIPDLMPFPVDPLGKIGVFVSLDANQKKRGGSFFTLKYVEYFWCPFRIWPVIKRDRHLLRSCAIASHPVRLRQSLERLINNQAGIRVQCNRSLTVAGPIFDSQDLALTFHVDVLTRRNIF